MQVLVGVIISVLASAHPLQRTQDTELAALVWQHNWLSSFISSSGRTWVRLPSFRQWHSSQLLSTQFNYGRMESMVRCRLKLRLFCQVTPSLVPAQNQREIVSLYGFTSMSSKLHTVSWPLWYANLRPVLATYKKRSMMAGPWFALVLLLQVLTVYKDVVGKPDPWQWWVLTFILN